MLPREPNAQMFPAPLDFNMLSSRPQQLNANMAFNYGVPLSHGVDALFQDYDGGTQLPLEFDFQSDLLPGTQSLADPRQNWHRQAHTFPSMHVHRGSAPQQPQFGGMSGQAQQGGQWRGGWVQEEHRGDIEHSSGDSFAGYKDGPGANASPGSRDVNMGEALPTMAPSRRSGKAGATMTQAEKDRERAEKLKEKNKRAQRKFRQRQKDRQESAEKIAGDLAEQLKAVNLEKAALERRNQQLEEALASRDNSGSPSPALSPQRSQEEMEPTFVPAQGWTEFNPRGGMVLMAICQPPRKLTHRQIMALSLRDVSKIMNELVVRLSDCLKALEEGDLNTKATATARLQALLSERHCLMAYLSVNEPKTAYKIWSTKMVDPPQPDCTVTDPNVWIKLLEVVQLTEQQKQTMMEVRRMYIRKVAKLFEERQALRQELQAIELVPAPMNLNKVPCMHLQWNDLTERLRQNIELTHRSHGYFLSRMYFSDIFSPVQVAKLITSAHPYPVDPYSICRLVSEEMGEPNYFQLLKEAVDKDGAGSTLALDDYVENWPEIAPEGESLTESGDVDEREPSPGVTRTLSNYKPPTFKSAKAGHLPSTSA